MRSPSITFDESLALAVSAVQAHLGTTPSAKIRFIRDMNGVLHIVAPDDVADDALAALTTRLSADLGVFAPARAAARRTRDTLAGEALFDEPVLITWIGDYPAYLIERRAMGQDWVLPPSTAIATHPPRFVFYSLKGGVGRSTALALWARQLTRQNHSVLLIDLDLEAPGLGAQLLPASQRPRFGVVDWLVQDLVSADTTDLVERLGAESPLADAGLWVVPAFGDSTDQHPDNVIAKLARAYLEKDTESGTQSFAKRLERLVTTLEKRYRPDCVLIDSRAGLHETAAANLLHLDAEVLCFAVNLPANWQGYRYLFGHLRPLAQSASRPAITTGAWRERFKMVNARAHAQREQDFIAHAFQLWNDTLYDELDAASDAEAFSFNEQDPAAPHYPLTITRNDAFERFDPLLDLDRVGDHAIQATFGDWFAGLAERWEMLRDGSP